MDLQDDRERARYRAKVRTWLADNRQYAPPERSTHNVVDAVPFRSWQRRLAAAGLVGVTWPVEHGGQGLGIAEQAIVDSELRAAGVPGAFDMIGVGFVGPALIAHGAPEQKERYLPPMLRGDETWCQLFSEPEAGSDLAAVRTRAVPYDSGWAVTGQKVWTTNAQHADYGFLLARTDADVPKHRGLTAFIVPMAAAGVTVRPLRQMSGKAEFNEVFLDGVRLDADAVVGRPGQGWPVAMTCLMFERFHLLTGLDQMGLTIESVLASLAALPLSERPAARQRVASVVADLYAVRFGGHRALTAVGRGGTPGPEAGLGKITLADALIRAAQLAVDCDGLAALDGYWGELLADMHGLRIAGGTREILLNTVGERVLGLPAAPRPDKDRPFRAGGGMGVGRPGAGAS